MHRQQQQQQHTPPLVPMLSDYGVAEITWENGQPAMHGLGRANETLESIVHQATACYTQSQTQEIYLQENQNLSSNVASSSRKWCDTAGPSYLKKRPRSSAINVHDQCVRSLGTTSLQEDNVSNCGTINSKDNDTTMMTWPSSDSPNQSMKSKNTDDDSAYQYGSENQEEECRTEGETVRSQSCRRSRAAAIHNQSERRRRERINQKMKALQKLVPNANKTDKASMLDEVIDYLKKLQAQVQFMKSMPIPPPQMTIPVPLQMQHQHQHQQHQLQMSMLARMGMGFGLQMGIPGVIHSPAHHPFMVPQTMINPATSQPAIHHTRPSTNTTTLPFTDPQTAFLAQHMNMDVYANMAAFYSQQAGRSTGTSSSPADHVLGE